MKLWSVGLAVTLLLNQFSLSICDDGHKPLQCIADLNKFQIETLQHFNGIFGSFKATTTTNGTSIYGPIIGLNITSSGYGFNTQTQKSDCEAENQVLRYGVFAKEANIQGDTFGDIWAETSTLDTKTRKLCPSPVGLKKDTFEKIWSFAPKTITETSEKLARLKPDTIIKSIDAGIVSISNSSNAGYRVLKLPACSDSKCSTPIGKHETEPKILKGDKNWNGDYRNTIAVNETLVINVPVYVGSTFTISTLNVNRNISPCQAIFNFYPVDQAGELVTDPKAYFTLVRSAEVTIAGTILAPQARIVDSRTGYFGGQLVSLQSYTGVGSSIKDFNTVSNGKCSFQSLCWPLTPATEAIMTSSNKTSPSVNGYKSNMMKFPSSSYASKSIAVPRETIQLKAHSRVSQSAENKSFYPNNFLDVDDALADVVNDFPTRTFTETEYTGTTDEMNLLIETETVVYSATVTDYEQTLSTTTLDQNVIDFRYATSYSITVMRNTLPRSYSTTLSRGVIITYLSGEYTFTTTESEGASATNCGDEGHSNWWGSNRHKSKHNYYKGKKYKDEDEDEDDDEEDDEDYDEEDD